MEVLVNKKKHMFFTKEVIKEVKVQDGETITALRTEANQLRKEIAVLKEDHAREIRNLNADIDLKVKLATSAITDEKNKLQQQKSVLEEKVSMLERAFENMGFDVKDMKDILNKLVDGVVSKNQVHIVK